MSQNDQQQQQPYPYPPYGYPYMHPGAHGYPPHMHHPYHPHMHYPHPQQPQMQQPPHPGHHDSHHSDALMAQSQQMLEGLMGEQAGIFKDLMHKLGVDDKEFWKGAMVGAAAALVLSNENVRGQLMGLLTGAGDLLKTGAGKVKEGAKSTASSAGENLNMGSEIFRDTYAAGKAGFQDSVARHRQPQQDAAEPTMSPAQPSDEQLSDEQQS